MIPRCYRKNRGGHCRSPVYAMNAKGEATCFYHARTDEIADVRARAKARPHEWTAVSEEEDNTPRSEVAP